MSRYPFSYWVFPKLIAKAKRTIVSNIDRAFFNMYFSHDVMFEGCEVMPFQPSVGESLGMEKWGSLRLLKLRDAALVRLSGRTFVVSDSRVNYRLSAPLNYKQGQWEVFARKIVKIANRNRSASSIKMHSALYVPDYYCDNFYHWILEFAPFLSIGSELAQSGVSTILPSVQRHFQEETLRLYPDIFWHQIEENHALCCDVLYIPIDIRFHPKGHGFSVINPPYLHTFAERVRKRWAIQEKPNSPEIVFVSRRNSPGRKILNEEEIIRFLENSGKRVFCLVPERLSLKEQVTAIANARIVMGPHGAGLANAVFSRAKKLVEIVPDSPINVSFRSLAYCMNMDYSVVRARANNWFLGNRSDMVLEPHMLEGELYIS